MNLVGKIFVVLIMVASTVFMTMGMMVYATHRNFLDEIMNPRAGYQVQLKNARDESAKLKGDIEKYQNVLTSEKAAHQQALAKSETERKNLDDLAKKLAQDVAIKAASLDKAVQDVQIAQSNLTALRTETAALRENLRDANKQTDVQLKIATETEDKLNIAMGQLADLKKRNLQLADDFAKANVLLKSVGKNYLDPANGQPPMLRGQILAIDKDDRVEISLGSDDGLREGHFLEVYRGNKYLGKMQVLEAQAHRAVGTILKEYKQEAIRTGDEVATKLKA